MKLKTTMSLVATALLTFGGLFVAAPAQADVTATLSQTTDLHSGYEYNLTLVDDGSFCPAATVEGGLDWAAIATVYDEWHYSLGNVYFYAAAAVNSGTSATYELNGSLPWLSTEGSGYNGNYTLEDIHCIDIDGNEGSVYLDPISFTSQEISITKSTVAQGESTVVTVWDNSGTWCDGNTGDDFSMGIALADQDWNYYYIPEGLEAGSGAAGLGLFTWGSTATATVTIPTSIPAGTYHLFAGCVSPQADGYQQPGPGMWIDTFEVTAAPAPAELAETGADVSTAGYAALVMLIAGTALILRKKVRMQK